MTEKTETPQKAEIFLMLALRRGNFERREADSAENPLSALSEQLPAAEAEKIEALRNEFESKTEEEKRDYLRAIENFIGSDEARLDETIHWSHLEAALQRETAAMQHVLAASLPAAYQNQFARRQTDAENKVENSKSRRLIDLEKSLRRAFRQQFVTLEDLPAAGKFDLLDGAQMARLIRLAGVREVALACAGIEAVESVAAFLRRFEPEDARAIAAQLGSLQRVSGERLLFAENTVHQALDAEPNPSSMLDLLGFRLIGILLGESADLLRVAYAEQKLPHGVAPRLSEIIETQYPQTPIELRGEISEEIERLAAKIIETSGRY